MINKEFIAQQKKAIEKQIKVLEGDAKNPKYEDVGSTNEDSALEFEEFENKVALGREAKTELVDLKRALKKIDEGKYGICEKCSEEIEHGRLKAFPASRFCSTHAK
ncbi:MAG: TraR/DksA C4-type zinc finger protein [bacterium]